MGRINFVLFSKLFPRFREHLIVSKLKQDSCHKVHTRLYRIYSFSFSYNFHFLLLESKLNMKFCHKNFLTTITSHYHWTQNRKCVTADEIWNPRAWFVLEENADREITWFLWCHHFWKALFSKCFVHTTRKSRCSQFLWRASLNSSVLENDVLVWMEGLTVEIKLCFQIPLAVWMLPKSISRGIISWLFSLWIQIHFCFCV